MQDSSSINAFSWFSMFYIPWGGICKRRTKTRRKSKQGERERTKKYQTKDPIPIFFPRLMSALLFTLHLNIPPCQPKNIWKNIRYKIVMMKNLQLTIMDYMKANFMATRINIKYIRATCFTLA